MSTELYKICQDVHYSAEYRNYFVLDGLDELIVECLVPISILCVCLNIYFFYRFPNARQPPFDILLTITLFSILNSIVYISTILYNKSNPPSLPTDDTDAPTIPQSFTNFCSVTGTMKILSQLGIWVYNTIFCFYYTCKIKNPLKVWGTDGNKEIHGVCLLVTGVGTVVMYMCDMVGVSAIGICGMKVMKSSAFVQLTIMFVYLAILVVSSVFFLKYLERIGRFDKKAKMFFKYYMLYTLLISLIYILQCVVMILVIVDCFTGISERMYQAYAKAGNILILLTPIAATLIICFHPQFGHRLIPDRLKKICKKNKQANRTTFYDDMMITNTRKSLQPQFLIELTEMKSNDKDKDMDMEKGKNKGKEFQKGYLSSFQEINRLSLLSTVLGCISLAQGRRKSQFRSWGNFGKQTEQDIFGWNFCDQQSVDIDEDIVAENKEYFVDSVPAAKINFVSYSPAIFEKLKQSDGFNFIQESTNPNRNLKKIYQNISADGGSSGQFFLFTYNNRIILKTISPTQLTVLKSRLENYYEYLTNNKNSLIVKMYGVYTVTNPESGQQIHFVMMGNLCQDIDKKYVHRIYDCKGSSHQREVFKVRNQDQNGELENQYSKKTMKDIDFDRLENKVWLSKDVSEKIKAILKSDSAFFESNGLIDYSLIIIKIDYNAYCLDLENRQVSFNNRTMFKNEKEPNMIYIFGIIDYLETWNALKKGQRWYKSLFARSDTISSQSPSFYSQRFCQNLIEKIFK